MNLNFKIILLLFAHTNLFNLQAQMCKLEIKVVDDKTGKVLASKKVSYRPLGKLYYQSSYTDSNGLCVIECKMKRNYEVIIEDEAYHWYSKVIELSADSSKLTCRLASVEVAEPSLIYTDLALEDYMHLGY